jgi:hypothetical protein
MNFLTNILKFISYSIIFVVFINILNINISIQEQINLLYAFCFALFTLFSIKN